VAQCRIARCFTSDARKHPSSGSVTLSWELLRSYSSFGCFECSFYNASIYVGPLRSPCVAATLAVATMRGFTEKHSFIFSAVSPAPIPSMC
jgi:hypothetical protein